MPHLIARFVPRALGLMVLAAVYGARRRMMRVASRFRAGRAAAWLGLHVWGGGLFLLLVLLITKPEYRGRELPLILLLALWTLLFLLAITFAAVLALMAASWSKPQTDRTRIRPSSSDWGPPCSRRS